jgi:magnesium-transporting ATPase (P-type)
MSFETLLDFWHGKAENITVGRGTKILDSKDQMRVRGQAAASYQICLVVSQVFHLFACTTRRVSLFKHGMISLAVFMAVSLELFLLLIFIYTPLFQTLLGIQTPPPFSWAFGILTGVVILIFTEFRKFILRQSAKNRCISFIEW